MRHLRQLCFGIRNMLRRVLRFFRSSLFPGPSRASDLWEVEEERRMQTQGADAQDLQKFKEHLENEPKQMVQAIRKLLEEDNGK